MKTYFFTSLNFDMEKAALKKQMVKYCVQNGLTVTLSSQKTTVVNREELEKGDLGLAAFDFFIIEVSCDDPQVGFLLAFALMKKRPVLCLFESGRQPCVPDFLKLEKKFSAFLTIESYLEKNFKKKIDKFLGKILAREEFDDQATIRFTFRISPRIDHYLEWRTHNTNFSKAELLRQEISAKIIKEDEPYQNYLRQKKNKNF